MKSTKNLAIGFALCLGLVACGQSAHRDQPDPIAPSSIEASTVPNEKVADLKDSSNRLIGDISRVTAEIKATQDQARLDDLNQQLNDLKAQYAKAQDELSDAEGYQLLLKFVIEHQVTSLDQLPAKFQEAKAAEQKKIDEIKGQEASFLTKIEASVSKLTDAKVVLKSVDRILRGKAAALQAKTELSPEEQQQLTAIKSFLNSEQQLVETRMVLSKAQAEIRVHEDGIAAGQKKKTDLTTQKSDLIRQLLQLPADDLKGRDQILMRIEKIQDQMVDIDLAIFDHQNELAATKTVVSDSEKSIESLKSTIESVVPGLSSISGTDLVAAMKNAEEADHEFQTLQTDYQKWRQDLNDSAMVLANISRLEAFFAQKYPDVKPQPQTGTNSPS